MAFGDVGGTLYEYLVTMKARLAQGVKIQPGDALTIVAGGAFEVTNSEHFGCGPLFGVAAGAGDKDGDSICVQVRGLCVLRYAEGHLPKINGAGQALFLKGIGEVWYQAGCVGGGTVLKVDEGAKLVHVLL